MFKVGDKIKSCPRVLEIPLGQFGKPVNIELDFSRYGLRTAQITIYYLNKAEQDAIFDLVTSFEKPVGLAKGGLMDCGIKQ